MFLFREQKCLNWTCFHVIISQEMTDISGASELRRQLELKLLMTACLCVDTSRPSLCRQLLNTNKQYIWQYVYVSSLNLAVLIFSSSCLLHFSFFFPPISRSPSLQPRTEHFPTESAAEGWAIVSCCRGKKQGGRRGGGGRPGRLPGCQHRGCVSVRKSRGDRSDDDRGSVSRGLTSARKI